MTITELLFGLGMNPICAICGEQLPLRLWDPEIGPMCVECGEFDVLAEVMLTNTLGICKPTHPIAR